MTIWPTRNTRRAFQSIIFGDDARQRESGVAHTLGFCLWCAGEKLGNYEDALWLTVSGGGDTDTNCAIVGGIVGVHRNQPSGRMRAKRARRCPRGGREKTVER